MMLFCFFKQKTAYEMRISDWSSDVCSSDLNAPGETRVVEREATRDHSERMLSHFGAAIRRREIDDGGHRAQEIVLTGQPELVGRAVQVPADPSSAAFPLDAALLMPGSTLRLPADGMNPQRIGLITPLQEIVRDHPQVNNRKEECVGKGWAN